MGPQENGTSPEQWLSQYGDVLFRFALRHVKVTDTAEDLVQETLLAALKSRNTFRGKASERTWLISILKHKVRDYLKRRNREMKAVTDGVSDEWTDSLFNEKGRWKNPPARWGTRPEAALEQAEFQQVFTDCLGHLPQNLHVAFQLKELEQNSTEDVCKELRITQTNLWVMLHRARLRLWSCLTKNWFGQEPIQ